MIYILQHVLYESPGTILDWLDKSGKAYTLVKLFAGDPLPQPEKLDALIIMGGPMNIYEENKYPWLTREKQCIAQAIEAGVKVLGICLGAQLIAHAMGAKVFRNPEPEIGWFPVEVNDSPFTQANPSIFPHSFYTFHWHGDTFEVPAGCHNIAKSEITKSQGFTFKNHVIALQFHAEMNPQGVESLINHADEPFDSKTYFVQTADEIRLQSSYFAANRKILFRLLNLFLG